MRAYLNPAMSGRPNRIWEKIKSTATTARREVFWYRLLKDYLTFPWIYILCNYGRVGLGYEKQFISWVELGWITGTEG